MTRFVKDLWQDLVDNRLWPVALALVAAAVAVPVLLGNSPAHEVAATPARPPGAPASDPLLSGSPVRVGPSGFRDALRNARLRDPFKQQHVPPAASTAMARVSPTLASSTGALVSSTTQTVGGRTGGGTGGGTGAAPNRTGGGSTPSRAPATGVKLKLRFGSGGGRLKIREVAPLTALPSSSNPVLIFLGLLTDGKTASFLVSSDSSLHGDGRCKPSAGVCQTLLMKEGDTEFLDIDQGAGAAQYQLEVDRIIRGVSGL